MPLTAVEYKRQSSLLALAKYTETLTQRIVFYLLQAIASASQASASRKSSRD